MAIKYIVLHCNYISSYSLINEKHSQLQANFCTVSFFNNWVNCEIFFVSCVFVYRSICSNLTWYQSLGKQGTSPPHISYWIIFFVLQVQLRMDSSVPLLTLSSNYSKWKKKMISSLMRQGLCWVSIGLGKECFSKINWLNKSYGYFGTIATGLSPSLCYLIRSIEDPKELWTRLDRTFGMLMRIIISLSRAHLVP